VKDKRRAFTSTQKTSIWYRQNWECNSCNEQLDMRTVKYDHIIRHSEWGLTILDNWQALCANCHSFKTFEENVKIVDNK
jgi:5-methylcytosine-specific restriction endonuclease McrA